MKPTEKRGIKICMLLRNTSKYTYGCLANTDGYIHIIHRDKQGKGEKGGEKGRRKI